MNNDKGELIIKSRVDSNRYTYRTRLLHKPQQFFDNNRRLLTIGLQDSSVATIDITGKRIVGKQRFAQPVIMALVSSSGDYLLVHTAEKIIQRHSWMRDLLFTSSIVKQEKPFRVSGTLIFSCCDPLWKE